MYSVIQLHISLPTDNLTERHTYIQKQNYLMRSSIILILFSFLSKILCLSKGLFLETVSLSLVVYCNLLREELS